MTIYKFSDDTEYHLSGQIHKEKRADEWCVIANDQVVKVKDEASADRYMKIYNRDRYKLYLISELKTI